MAIKKREYGEEQPGIPLGIFKIRIPFVHFRLELPEIIQGFFMVTVGMGAIANQQELFGIDYDMCVICVSLNSFMYIMHPFFGDPIYPGWITPAMPLVVAWALQYATVTERIQAIGALQYEMAFLFLFLGITGLGGEVVSRIPKFMKGGIVLGSGLSAVTSVFKAGGKMAGYEITALISIALAYLTINSKWFEKVAKKNAFLTWFRKLGMVPGFLVAYALGVLVTHEIVAPVIQWGISPYHYWPEVIQNYSMIGVGFAGAYMYISALPMALTAYIIAYGDFVTAKQLSIKAQENRGDEKIIFNANRCHILCGCRNAILGTLCPYCPLSGPMYGGGTFSCYERYKAGPDAMPSIWGGLFSFTLCTTLATVFKPTITFFKPIYMVGLCTTYMVQAFGCGYVAMDLLESDEERAMGLVTAVVLAIKGAAWGLATGFILYFLVGYSKETRERCKAETAAELAMARQIQADAKAESAARKAARQAKKQAAATK